MKTASISAPRGAAFEQDPGKAPRRHVVTDVVTPPLHTSSLLVRNKPGVLVRVSLVFSRRGYNMESLVVSPALSIAGLDAAPGEFSRMTITCCNNTLMESYSISTQLFHSFIDDPSNLSKTHVFIAVNKKVEGLFFLEDELKSNSREIISELKSMQLKTVLLSGDNNAVAKSISETAGYLTVIKLNYYTMINLIL